MIGSEINKGLNIIGYPGLVTLIYNKVVEVLLFILQIGNILSCE